MKRCCYILSLILLLGLNSYAQSSKMNLALALKAQQGQSGLITAFIKGDPETIRSIALSAGGKIKYAAGDISAVQVPASALSLFAGNEKIQRMEAYPPNLRPLNDTMLLNNNVPPVHNGMSPLTQGYNGAGVVMGIIDSGIDFSHPDLRDSLGNTRITWLWDQSLPVAASTPSYGYGQEWDSAGINGGLAAAHTDIPWNGHGTHVAGVAAGNGLASGTYKGVAYKSELVVVAFDFYSSSPTIFTDAVDYIYSKAAALGKPCVINASLGGYYGSHDGLDLEAQMVKNMVTAQSGRSLVAAAGNAGDVPFHLGYTVTADTNFTLFQSSGGNLNIGIYGDTADLNNVQFSIGADQTSPTHSFRGRIPFSAASSHLSVIGYDTLYNAGNRIGIVQSYASLSGGTYSLEFNIQSDSSTYAWRLISTGSGKFDVWDFNVYMSPPPSMATMPDSMYYKAPDLNQTICSGFQCLDEVITVGNYTNRKSMLNYNSVMFIDNTRIPGKRHPNSSSGPTRDGRIKPDIAAPGDFIMSCSLLSNLPADAIAYPDYYDPGGFHTLGGGTSAASPGVAGIAALYLQKNPTATAMDIKNAIISCTTVDGYTGAVPNNSYGYGKANAFTALTGCLTTEIPENTEAVFHVFPNPAASGSIVNISIRKELLNTRLLVYSSNGQLVMNEQISSSSVDLKNLNAWIYFMQIVKEEKVIAGEKIIILPE